MAEGVLVIFKDTTIYTKCHKRILMHSNTVNKRKSHTHDMYTFLTNRSLWWFLLVTFIGSATVRVIVGTLHCSSRIRVYILYSISMQVKYTGRRPHWLCFFRLCCMYYRRQWEEVRYELELASGITQGEISVSFCFPQQNVVSNYYTSVLFDLSSITMLSLFGEAFANKRILISV